MKIHRVVRSFADRIQGRVQKPNRRPAQDGGPLIDQRREGRPQRRGATRAADARFRLAVVRDDINVVRRHGHVGNVALGRRTLIGHHVDALLPGGNGIAGADSAAAAPITTSIRTPCGRAVAYIPDLFRNIRPARATHRQGRSPDTRDVGTGGGSPDGVNPGVSISRRLEK